MDTDQNKSETVADDEFDYDSDDMGQDLDYGDDGDFSDEDDWESYDESEYLDDGDEDGALLARRAAFNKLLIGGAVVIALGVGVFLYKSNTKEENMGEPQMEEIAAPQVSGQGVAEFTQAQTPSTESNAFGVKYGEDNVPVAEPVAEQQKTGILNNPDILKKVTRGEKVKYEGKTVDVESEAERNPEVLTPIPVFDPEPADEQALPPMPTPVKTEDYNAGSDNRPVVDTENAAKTDEGGVMARTSQEITGTQKQSDDNKNAVTMGQVLPQPETESEKAPFQKDVIEMEEEAPRSPPVSRIEETVDAVQEKNMKAEPAAVQTQSKQLSAVLDRLNNIEKSVTRIEGFHKEIDTLEKEIADLKKRLDRSAAIQSNRAATAPSQKTQVITRKTIKAPPSEKEIWLLKAAQPGRAMLLNKKNNDTVTVNIGDTISGVGRVTGIFIQEGRWVVQGTQGRVLQ